jgi:hypothetical protein
VSRRRANGTCANEVGTRRASAAGSSISQLAGARKEHVRSVNFYERAVAVWAKRAQVGCRLLSPLRANLSKCPKELNGKVTHYQ